MLRKCLSAWVAVAPLPSAAWAQLPLVEHGASGWVARIDESWIEGQVGLDLDGQGRPHVVYGVFEEGLRWELWYQRWDPISRRWLPDEPLVEDILCDAYPDIAVEADGTAHVVYCDGTEDDGGNADPYGAMYCKVPPGGVACAERRLVESGARDWRGGHGIALDAQGRPTVLFQDAFTGDVRFETRTAVNWPSEADLVFDCEGLDERCCQGLSKPSLDFAPGGIPAVSCGNIDNFDARDGDALPGPPPVIVPAIHTAWKSAGAWVYDADPPVGPVGGPWVQAFAVGGDTRLGQTWFDASPGVGAVKYREAKIGSGWASATIESSLAGGFGDVATDLKVEDSGAMAVAYNEAGLAKTLRYARRDGPGITNFTPGFVDGHCEHHMRWLDLELSPDTDESPRTFYRSSRSNPQAAFDAKYTAWDDEPWPFAQPPGPPPGAVIDGATGSASDRIDPGQPHATGDRWICYREAVGWPIPQYDLYLLRWDGKDRVWDPAELIKADVGPAPDDAGRHCAVAVWEPDGGGARKVGIAYADSSGAGTDLRFRESVGGGPWGVPPAVDQTLGHLDLHYLANGRAAVAYRNGPGEPSYGEIWNDGIWNQQTVVVRPGLGGSVHLSLALDQPRQRPRLPFSRGSDLHLVWPASFNNFNWPAVAANEQVWARRAGLRARARARPRARPALTQRLELQSQPLRLGLGAVGPLPLGLGPLPLRRDGRQERLRLRVPQPQGPALLPEVQAGHQAVGRQLDDGVSIQPVHELVGPSDRGLAAEALAHAAGCDDVAALLAAGDRRTSGPTPAVGGSGIASTPSAYGNTSSLRRSSMSSRVRPLRGTLWAMFGTWSDSWYGR